MRFVTKNKVHYDRANEPHFIFVKIPVQEHEGEIGEEGTRLDLCEEGEEEKTGTVRTNSYTVFQTLSGQIIKCIVLNYSFSY